VRFAGLNPDEFFQKSAGKAEFQGTVSPEKIQQLRDSLDNIIYPAIHYETDEKLRKNLKDLAKNLQERIEYGRGAISKADAPKSIKEEESDLVDALIKGISITAAILLSVIILLIIKITRRSKEVEKVTERLKNLQTEPMPPPPLEGLDPTVFSTRFPRAPLPQVKPLVQNETPVPPAPEPPKMRKTTKQRVTEAVQKMVAALDSLRKYGNTVKTPVAEDERLTKTVRVPSPNSTRINPPVDETTYDRRAREKKQILDWAKQGRTPSEIAKWLNLPRDQVETVIRLARERGE